jgi:hypothetical protein
MKKLKLFPLFVLIAAIAVPSFASDGTAAFDRMKKLAGAWSATTAEGKNVRVTYEVIANGSAIVERESGDHEGMETVYHLDGDKLVLEHYCMAGNQPRMSASGYNPQTGELKFDFVSAGNLKSPNDGHMHDAKFRFINDNQFAAEWTFFKDGKAQFSEKIQYKRVE